MLSIVTTCMGRLDYLKQTVDSYLAVLDSEVVVVDYSDPDRCGDWLKANRPTVRVVSVPGEKYFNAASARNAGAAAAKGDWLAMVDSDVILRPEFRQVVEPLMKPGRFISTDKEPNLGDLLIVRAEDFHSVAGYDVRFEGWGPEDRDIKYALEEGKHLHRFELAGCGAMPCTHIDHDDALRTANHKVKDKHVSGKQGSRLIKQNRKDRSARHGGLELDGGGK